MKNMMIYFFCTMILAIGCSDNSTNNPGNILSENIFTDSRDGKNYGIVKINSQVWMSENLNASTYRNGDIIRYARNRDEWKVAAAKQEGAWCYYNNEPKNGDIYGKLYNWYAVNDSRGLAPIGYHIPTMREWTILTQILGGEGQAGQKMKSRTGWANNANGDNSSGFNGLPCGCCSSIGFFDGITGFGSWWSSEGSMDNNAFSKHLFDAGVFSFSSSQNEGLSVRCLRD